MNDMYQRYSRKEMVKLLHLPKGVWAIGKREKKVLVRK